MKVPRMKRRRVRLRNPNQLATSQHVFPARCVERFAGTDGRVAVRLLSENLTKRLKPRSAIFCRNRAWDHGTETGFMKSIEDDYQVLVDQLIPDPEMPMSAEQNHKVSLFIALWRFRTIYVSPADEIRCTLLNGGRFTQEQEENLEKNGYAFVRDGVIPAPQFVGVMSRIWIGRFLRQLGPVQWSTVIATKGHFLVPDIPYFSVIPAGPSICLTVADRSALITESELANVNGHFVVNSSRFVFSDDFAHCPIRLPGLTASAAA